MSICRPPLCPAKPPLSLSSAFSRRPCAHQKPAALCRLSGQNKVWASEVAVPPPEQNTADEAQPDQLKLGPCHAVEEGSNPPLVLRNPARDKAESQLKAAEAALVLAEEKANTAVEVREKSRGTARISRERLCAAETAYVQVFCSSAELKSCNLDLPLHTWSTFVVGNANLFSAAQGCNTLERLTEEYGETRFEVEIALARAEAELVDANEFCNRALHDMKAAEDVADAALLVLRQAEMEHESAVQRLARMLSKSVESSNRSVRNLDTSLGLTAVNTRRAVQDSRPLNAVDHELAAHGIRLDAGASETMVESLLQVVRNSGQSPMSSASKAVATAAHNMSVRLMGFGKSSVCLGHDSDVNFDTPTEVRALLQTCNDTPVGLACSDDHGLIVTDGGEVLSWGADASGRLGHGAEAMSSAMVHVPRPVQGLQGVTVKKVACCRSHSLAMTIDGDLFAWGSAADGLLGLAAEQLFKLPIDPATGSPYSSRAIKVEGFHGPLTKYRVRDMACGDTFNVACCVGGMSYSWGSSKMGCLGNGDTKKIVATPTEIDALRGQKIAQVAAGLSHVLALTESCDVWAWGSAEFGKLGIGDVSQLPADSEGLIHASHPLHLEDLRRKHVVQVAVCNRSQGDSKCRHAKFMCTHYHCAYAHLMAQLRNINAISLCICHGINIPALTFLRIHAGWMHSLSGRDTRRLGLLVGQL